MILTEFQKMQVWQFCSMLLDFQEKNESMDFCIVFGVGLGLKCDPFIGKRSELLGKKDKPFGYSWIA